jgi:hypothetical protein
MQGEQRRVDQPAEPRKDVKEKRRRFRIVKLEERIAPGGGHGNGSNASVVPFHYSQFTHKRCC